VLASLLLFGALYAALLALYLYLMAKKVLRGPALEGDAVAGAGSQAVAAVPDREGR
jgi:cytochrome bd-type quinol oxidase subunit 1